MHIKIVKNNFPTTTQNVLDYKIFYRKRKVFRYVQYGKHLLCKCGELGYIAKRFMPNIFLNWYIGEMQAAGFVKQQVFLDSKHSFWVNHRHDVILEYSYGIRNRSIVFFAGMIAQNQMYGCIERYPFRPTVNPSETFSSKHCIASLMRRHYGNYCNKSI